MILAKEEKRILLDGVDINWEFTVRETTVFRMMWRDGKSIDSIVKKLKRPALEIALLIVEQSELGNIDQRQHGLYGS